MSTRQDKRLAPDEGWDALEKAAIDDEVDRALGASDTQLDDEIREAGFDPVEVRARGEAIGRELDAKRAASKHARATARPRWVAFAAAAAIGVVLVAIVLAARSTPRPRGPEPIGPDDSAVAPSPAPPPPQVAAEDPAKLRERALADCARGALSACEQELDRADDLDPAGENDPRVLQARKQIASKKPK